MDSLYKRLKDYEEDQNFAEKILMKSRQKETLEEELIILGKKTDSLFSEFNSVKEIIDAVVNGTYMSLDTSTTNKNEEKSKGAANTGDMESIKLMDSVEVTL